MSERESGRESAAATFARSAEGRPRGFVAELFDYLRASKKWWLAPVVLALVLVGAFIILGGTAAAPLIYTLF